MLAVKSMHESELTQSKKNLHEFIEAIGDRIRSLRAKRGMTRKGLSKHSDVSERYLAQLETGKANITLSVLWRVAGAFECAWHSPSVTGPIEGPAKTGGSQCRFAHADDRQGSPSNYGDPIEI